MPLSDGPKRAHEGRSSYSSVEPPGVGKIIYKNEKASELGVGVSLS